MDSISGRIEVRLVGLVFTGIFIEKNDGKNNEHHHVAFDWAMS